MADDARLCATAHTKAEALSPLVLSSLNVTCELEQLEVSVEQTGVFRCAQARLYDARGGVNLILNAARSEWPDEWNSSAYVAVGSPCCGEIGGYITYTARHFPKSCCSECEESYASFNGAEAGDLLLDDGREDLLLTVAMAEGWLVHAYPHSNPLSLTLAAHDLYDYLYEWAPATLASFGPVANT